MHAWLHSLPLIPRLEITANKERGEKALSPLNARPDVCSLDCQSGIIRAFRAFQKLYASGSYPFQLVFICKHRQKLVENDKLILEQL